MRKLFFVLALTCWMTGSAFALSKVAIIKVKGMTCPLCTSAVKKSLKQVKGVIQAKVRLNTELATVVFDANKTTPQQLLKAIRQVGYTGTLLQVKDK